VSVSYVSAELRRTVARRAGYLCEYCLTHEEDTFLECEVDHIISEKHGGRTCEENLAYACFFCNRHKGSDVGSVVPGTERFVRFYNPRKDRWPEHFALSRDGIIIEPLSEIGEATVRIFGFNAEERILERKSLSEIGRYPVEEAREG
jgi:hypothetical protein